MSVYLPIVEALAALETILQDQLGPSVFVTQDPSPPTMDQCPCVQVLARRVSANPLQIVGAIGAQDDTTMTFELGCWQFSGESGDDAARQRNQLAVRVHAIVRANVGLAGVVQFTTIPQIDFGWEPNAPDGGLFAKASITVLGRLIV